MCTICLDTIVMDNNITKLPCNHVFHNICFDQWSAVETEARIVRCPNCRYEIRKRFKYTNPPDFVILFDDSQTQRIATNIIIMMFLFNIIIIIVAKILLKF